MDFPTSALEFTQLLQRHRLGDESARDRLLTAIYDELRRLAIRYMSNERSNHTLQPTALVHEAWMRIESGGAPAQNKSHFLALAAGVMKEVLIDHARKNRAAKRGGGETRIEFEDALSPVSHASSELIELCDSLEKLKELEPRQAKLVDLRVFGGLSFEEASEAIGVSLATVKRDWTLARAWLFRELTGA